MKAAAPSQLTATRPACPARFPLWTVAAALTAGLALRLWLFLAFSQVTGDSLIYGDIAKNLLLHGQYALTEIRALHPTLIRLPGYPLLVASVFRLFGMENYAVVSWLQIALDLAACLLLAGFARRIASRRAALCTLWLAALCPFTASYAGTPLAETPTLFAIALALWAMAAFVAAPNWAKALLFTLAILMAALLRPDGALVAVALAPPLLIALYRHRARLRRPLSLLLVCLLLIVGPFAAWTARNWKVFHLFQPLAPRLANDPGEDPNLGWQHWVQSWCREFDCTYNVYWTIPGNRFEPAMLPGSAFDSPAQRAETESIAAQYNRNGYKLTPDLDRRLDRLAGERSQAHPLRHYVLLPVTRAAVMWLRPRNENLPLPLDRKSLFHKPFKFALALAMAGLNLVLFALAMAGLWLRPRFCGWMLLYFVLRSALLMTIQAPEARYTLECFPMMLALGGIALAHFWDRLHPASPQNNAVLS